MSAIIIRKSIECENCKLYLTVADKTRILALARGILFVDAARDDETGTALMSCCLTLFDACARVGFPYDDVAGDILAGNAASFLITADVVHGRAKIRQAFRNCVPAPRMGLGSARDRWTFKVEPDRDLCQRAVFEDWGERRGGA